MSESTAVPASPEALPSRLCPVVGIGASAGGLEALEQLFVNMSAESGAAFVVVTHLAPHQPSLMPELLAKQTAMSVSAAKDGAAVVPNHVYIIPPNSALTFAHGVLRLESRDDSHGTLIDTLFRSLAEDREECAIGIILSGTGSDGSLGIQAIKEHGGMAMVQEVASAKYDSMPRNAIAAAQVDWVLPVEAMPAKLVEYLAQLERRAATATEDRRREEPPEVERQIKRICELIRRKTGHDFSRYKPTTLVRRVQRRAQMTQRSLDEYAELLAGAPDELDRLFQDLLIGVTQFFRDPEVFAALASDIVPRILAEQEPNEPVRVWVPGCATGEEAYSIAILLAEALPAGSPQPRIFATDIDDEALTKARSGRFPDAIAGQLSQERLARFFLQLPDGGWQVLSDIRDMCVFSTHNLITDPPFSRMDLISCRNLLIYLESETQKSILPLFHYALRPARFLLLGPSENVTGGAELFTAVDAKLRIFQRKEVAVAIRLPLGGLRPFTRRSAEVLRHGEPMTREEGFSRRIERLILAAFAPPAVVVRADGEIVFVSGQTRKYLELAPGSVGVNVCEMAGKDLRPHLHVLLHEASTRGQERVHHGVTVSTGDEVRRLDLAVCPLPELGADADLYAVVFREAGPPAGKKQAEAAELPDAQSRSLVEALELELRSTRENLQTTVEDLEVANEELRSINEELQSSNEELQSSNEELQTSKEELQSINEELQTVNSELSRKINELDRAHGDLQNLFASTRIATVFLGRDLTVKRFSPEATQLFHLIESDVGRPITDIVHAFTGGDLVADVKQVLRSQAASQREIRRRDTDVWYRQRIEPYRTAEGVVVGVVLTFVDITELKSTRDAARRLAVIVESSHDAILSLSADHEVRTWNQGAAEMFGYTAAEMIGHRIERLLGPDTRSTFESLFEAMSRGERAPPVDVVLCAKDGAPIRVLVSMSPISTAGGQDGAVSCIARDITQQEQNRADLEESRETDRRKTEFLALLAHELRNPLAPVRNAVHLLGDPRTSGADARRAAAMIERQVAHMARLVDDLMDASRISSGKLLLRKELEELAELVRTVIEDHRAEAVDAGVTLELTAEEPLWVRGDATRLSQCIGNIIGNAIKFTDRGGQITVSLGREDDAAVLRVRDTGVGMDAETQARAFEPFAQASRHVTRGRGGLGLGLSLVKALIELHGGRVRARSAGPGRGTEVVVRLPLAPRPSQSEGPRPEVEPEAGERRRVLVIEDNEDSADSTRALLEMWGHTAVVAESGREGLQAALRAPPDVVLCDLSLSGEMDGYDVCRALRAAPATARAHIIAITGHSLASDRRKVSEAGFDEHLIKPVDPEVLRQLIGNTVAPTRRSTSPGCPR